MRSIGLFLCLCFSISFLMAADWTGFQGCGHYQVRGVVRTIENTQVIVLNEKSKSEIQFKLPIDNEPMLSPYVNRAIDADLEITKPMNGSKGNGIVKKIKERIPNPINPLDTGLSFVKKSECKK